jgi:hypothetical protein
MFDVNARGRDCLFEEIKCRGHARVYRIGGA